MRNAIRNLTLALMLALFGISIIVVVAWLPQSSANIIFQTESPYQSIYISEVNGVRIMHAGSLLERSSAMDLQEPYRHIYEYTAMMMLALGYVREHRNFLVAGLGGGTATRTLRRLYPDARIVNVEFDPEVVKLAGEYFNFSPDAKMEVVVQDARRWIRGAEEKFDIIFLDAFHGGYIPFHLTTREFLELVRKRLAPGGVVCSNTRAGRKLADRESATYHAVFGDFHHYFGERSKNRVIVASPEGVPDPETLRGRLAELNAELDSRYLDFPSLFESHFKPDTSWPGDAKILTDDHAPVNLLKEMN